MKRKPVIYRSCAFVLVLLMAMGSILPVSAKSTKKKTEYIYSNLTDKNTRSYVRKRMMQAGIPTANINEFMKDVKDYNKIVGKVGLTSKGFVKINKLPYDAKRNDCIKADDKRIARWNKQNKDMEGYNCRITAYMIFRNNVTVANRLEDEPLFLTLDMANIENKKFTEKQKKDFVTLFCPVMTPVTKDKSKVVALAKEQWNTAGIRFNKDAKAKLITVRTHLGIDKKESELDVGHAGVLIPDKKGYLFIEKLSFQSPYQVLKFKSKNELKAYLNHMYQFCTDPTSIKPFIMENDTVL